LLQVRFVALAINTVADKVVVVVVIVYNNRLFVSAIVPCCTNRSTKGNGKVDVRGKWK
jgi:hypothetical protein